jgi:hypothetical protein
LENRNWKLEIFDFKWLAMNNLFQTSFCHFAGIGPLYSFFALGVSRRRADSSLQDDKRFVLSTFALLILFFNFNQRAFAQEIQLNEDPKIAQLWRNWTNSNRANPRIEGWRVQIMATTDRQQVEEARNNFRLQHPDVPAEWTHEKPYYKLRVGAFRNKLEAQAFIASLTDYAGAYPAKDGNIHPRDFLE